MNLARVGLLILQICSCIHGVRPGDKSSGDLMAPRLNPSVHETTIAALQVESRKLNEQLQGAARDLQDGPTKNLLQTLALCAPCQTYERFGEDHDGGYVMCMDGLGEDLKGAMSYGVSGYDGWGMQVASRFQIPLHEYDCTNPKEPEKCDNCDVHFHFECIRAANSAFKEQSQTLEEQLTEADFKDQEPSSLLMKIDVESAEWEIFANEPTSSLEKFRQIVVEYHALGDTSKHEVYSQAVKKLADAGFRVTHLHGNNFEGVKRFGKYSIPNVLEATYIRSQGCTSGVPYELEQDQTNNANAPELEAARLPDSGA